MWQLDAAVSLTLAGERPFLQTLSAGESVKTCLRRPPQTRRQD